MQDKQITLIGLSGSLRKESYNTGLLHAAAELMPEGVQLVVKTIHGIPLYDGDLEAAQGLPPTVLELGNDIAQADGLLLATPEYNNSIPGPLKNAIDWLSRMDDVPRPVFAGKPVAVIGASPGGFGSMMAQAAWLPVLRALETRMWFGGKLFVARAGSLFDGHGYLTDANTRERLRDFVLEFAQFARA